MGGIETDAAGKISVAGLFAAGECACNGLNGAGRLAGNTLTEAVVFGKKVGEAAAEYARSASKRSFPATQLSDQERGLAALTSGGSSKDSSGRIHSELGRLMNDKVGFVRDRSGTQEGMDRIQSLKERYQKLRVGNPSRIYNYELTQYLELGSMLKLAEVVTLSARARTESRGAHRRADFPKRDDANWRCHTRVSLVQGAPRLDQRAVKEE